MAMSIAQWHADCYSAFEKLLGVVHDAQSPDHGKLQDEFDKYSLWAGNVGAGHSGKRYNISLDYRLREASFFKDQVVKLLAILKNQLQKTHQIIIGERTPFEDLSLSLDEGQAKDEAKDEAKDYAKDEAKDEAKDDESQLQDQQIVEDSPWEISSDSGSDEETFKQIPEPVTEKDATSSRPLTPAQLPKPSKELPQLMQSIQHCVKCLYNLPLRKPAPLDRLKDRSTEELSHFQYFDVLYVKDKFPDPRLGDDVKVRLGKMITRRRQLLLYRRRHKLNLQADEAISNALPNPSGGRTGAAPTETKQIVSVADKTPRAASTHARSEISSTHHTLESKATTFKMDGMPLIEVGDLLAPSVATSDYTMSIAASEATRDIHIQVPPRPKDCANGEKPFECDYCCLPVRMRSDRAWRNHVLNDLQPYICTYSDCSLVDYMFEDQDAWFTHELEYHRFEYFCNTEDHQVYKNQEEFGNHLREIHNLNVSQSTLLLETFQRPSVAAKNITTQHQTPTELCNLCFRPTHNLKKHVARHLQQISLFAVPRAHYSADEDYLGNDGSNVPQHDSGASSSEGIGKPGSQASETESAASSLPISSPKAPMEDDLQELPDDIIEHNEVPLAEEVVWDNVTDKFSRARHGESELPPFTNVPTLSTATTEDPKMVSPESPEKYTIAWVCTMHLEMVAATAMLDRIHFNGDYTLGNIHKHNVIIICASSTGGSKLQSILSQFPMVQCVLFVGVGGGAPRSDDDIRLGDVVVGWPAAANPQKVRYPYEFFVNRSAAAKIPQWLISALSSFEVLLPLDDALWHDLLSAVPINQELASLLSSPGQENDLLFSSDSLHDPDSSNLWPPCGKCDKDQLVDREPRRSDMPQVHHGTIASRPLALQYAGVRDRLSRECGILCFEAEVAGLLEVAGFLASYPSVTICGICDYCDSHKNVLWKGYAALTAAATTKVLLSKMPPHQKTARKPWERSWMVPFNRNPLFVGRKDELQLLEGKVFGNDLLKMTAITGPGGIGKTELAIELACRIRYSRPDCSVFYMSSTNRESVEQACISVSDELMLKETMDDLKLTVRDHLSRNYIGRWLLIIDDVEDGDLWLKDSAESPALRRCIPQSDQGYVIFITRNRNLATALTSENITILPESPEEATKILENSLTRQPQADSEIFARVLLQKISFLPLATRQACAVIHANSNTVEGYINLLDKQDKSFIRQLSENFGEESYYPDAHPAASTWLEAFRYLDQIDGLAKEYLLFTACVDPFMIPLSFLPEAPSADAVPPAIHLLRTLSFIQVNEDFIYVHKLVHLATRNWLKIHKLFKKWIMKTADRLIKVFETVPRSEWKDLRGYMPHVHALLHTKEFQVKRRRRIRLLLRVEEYFLLEGRFQDAVHIRAQIRMSGKTSQGASAADRRWLMARPLSPVVSDAESL